MLLGIVSDTHGHVPFAQQAVRMLGSLGVKAVIHCGDIGSPEIVPLFSPWPAHFVLGNVDLWMAEELEAAVLAAGQTFHHRLGTLELAGTKIAVLHSDDGEQFRQVMQSDDWDLVCYGHTHQADIRKQGRTLVLNPGALYRANPHSLAVVRLPELEATIVSL